MVVEENLSVLERAEKIHKETLEAEARLKEHRAKIEEYETNRIMSGQSNIQPIPQAKEETPLEYKNRILRGG